MTPYLKLPLRFDLAELTALQCDVARLPQDAWVAHFNTTAYEHGWSFVALKSPEGRADASIPVDDVAYRNTALLQSLPALQVAINRFECETTSVRLMSLASGAKIKPHRDQYTSLEDGITRIHVPIITSSAVAFCIDGEAVHFEAGYAWYLNASCLHGVDNSSSAARVHLMIDCVTNDWLQALFVMAGGILRESKYGDPAIDDQNVADVIAGLRAMGNPAALRVAEDLARIAKP